MSDRELLLARLRSAGANDVPTRAKCWRAGAARAERSARLPAP